MNKINKITENKFIHNFYFYVIYIVSKNRT